MLKTFSVDYGRSTIKAVKGFKKKDKVIFPSVISYDPEIIDKKADLREVNGINKLNYLKIKIDGEELGIGKAAQGGEYSLDSSNYNDVKSDRAKNLILTAISLMLEEQNRAQNINLVLSLPADQYSNEKENFSNKFEDEKFEVKLYDYDKEKYLVKKFYINNVIVKQQGFLALMHHILNENGKFRSSKTNIINNVVSILDVGKYSTDLFVCDSLTPVNILNSGAKIPGMSKAFNKIREGLMDKHNLRIRAHKLQETLENNSNITKNGEPLNIDDILKASCSKLAEVIKNHAENKIDMSLNAIDEWLACGGGANSKTLLAQLSGELNRDLKIISNPRWANALGGLKIGKRQFEGEN